jgi:transposase
MTELERLNQIGADRVSATLKRFVSIRTSAKRLGVSHTALRRWMTANQIIRVPSSPEEKLAARRAKAANKQRAALLLWIRENPEVTLPRKTSEVARITGVSRNQVKTFLYRRRRRAKSMMNTCAKYLSRLPVPLVDNEGKPTTTLCCSGLTFYYDHWSLKVRMSFTDAVGKAHEVDVHDLERLHGIVLEAVGITPSTLES